MRKEVIVHKDPKSPISEIFRTLRTNIQFMNTNKKMKTLLLTSTSPYEGKSWISSNLAVTFAQAGKKVILVDADMRKGRQYAIFGVSPKPGLSNFLSGLDLDENENINNFSYLEECIQETEVDNLYLMSAGNVPPNPSELLVSKQMIQLLEELKSVCDIVIIDGTPCELVADSIILSRLVDLVVVVAEYKKTKKDALNRIIKNIKNVGGNFAGVVVNKMPVSAKRYNEIYYYGASSKMNKSQNKLNNSKHNKHKSSLFNFKKSDSKDDLNMNEVEEKEDKLKKEKNEVQRTFQSNIKIENADEISEERTQHILDQINDYLKNGENK